MKKSLALVFILSGSVCCAQFPDYYVHLVRGTVTVLGNSSPSKVLRQGDYIYNKQVLVINKNAEVTLLDRNAQYFVLNKPGTFKVSSFSKQSSKQISSVTQKYLHLVWDQVFNPDYDYSKFKKKNLTGVWGGVSRAIDCANLIFPFKGLKTAEDSLHFKWLQTSPSSEYIFFIYDSAGNELMQMPVKDTQQTISKQQISQNKNGIYRWRVKSNDRNSCEKEVPSYFELLSKEDEAKLVAALKANNPDTSLIGQLDMIDEMEESALIEAASHCYAKLVRVNPDNIALRKSYVLFLLKYGYDDVAFSVWKHLEN